MLTKYIPQNIQEKLKAKERALARKLKPQTTPNDGYLGLKDIASRTIFVRMCSNKVNPKDNMMIDGGWNRDIERKTFGFHDTYPLSGLYSLGKYDEFGKRPVAGIKNIEIQYKGGFKAIRECTVTWVVPSLDDLDIFNDYFFTVGKTVVVDWGWIYADGNIDTQLADTFITRETLTNGQAQFNVKQEIFTNPQTIITSKNGDYDAIGGQITNFEYNLRSDGGFDCTTKIISMGASLFKRPLDVGGNQAGIKVKGKDARTTPPDSLVNCVLNLEPIILKSVFKVDGIEKIYETGFFSDGVLSEIGDIAKSDTENIKSRRLDISDKNNYNFLVDDKDNPQVLWVDTNTQPQAFFVTWGWMEDNIISRYTSFTGGKDKDVKMTMRSLDTVFDEKGNPIPLSKNDNEFDSRLDDIEIEGDDAILKLSNIGENNVNTTLQKSVQIRKPPFLLPVNPFRFFTSGMSKEYAGFLGGGGTISVSQKYYNSFFTVGDAENFRKFAEENEEDGELNRKGSLRNIWINIKEIQSAFGIKNARSKDTTNNNINPPGTLDVAINNLLTELNANFHNVWDFELIGDPYNPTNIKVVDKSDSEIVNPQYTKYVENSHKVQDLGVFQFPSFKMGSTVKNQTLNFKIPDAQALTILYGSNKKEGESDQDFVNGQLQKLFEIKMDRKKDAFLADLESSKYSSKGDGESLNLRVGSVFTEPNSKIGVGDEFGIEINPTLWSKWWKIWKPDIEKDESGKEDETAKPSYKNLWGFLSDGSYEVQQNEKENKPEVIFIKGDTINNVTSYYETTSGYDNHEAVLVPGIQRVLNSYMHASSPVAQFDMSNLVPAELGLEIDGTGGITPFDIIHTEYIQSVYKSDIKVENFVMGEADVMNENLGNYDLDEDISDEEFDALSNRTTPEQQETTSTRIGPLTFFQITDVKHTLDNTGWKTELTSKMRINRIQRSDKIKNLDVSKGKIEVTTRTTHSDITGSNSIPADPESGIVTQYRGEEVVNELVFDAPVYGVVEKAKKTQELSPPSEDNAYILPGGIVLGERIPEDPETNRETAEKLRKAGYKVYNFDYTPYDFGTPKEEDPPIEPSAPIAKSYLKNPELRKMPNTEVPIPDFVEQKSIPEVKTYRYHTRPVDKVDTRERGVVQQVKGSTFTDMRFAKLNEKEWQDPVVATIEATEPMKEKAQTEEIEVEVPQELNFIELESTYKFQYLQNQILYALREDWRPLYEKDNGKLTGARYKKGSDGKKIPIPNTSPVQYEENKSVRGGQPQEVRQAYWDAYIEGKNKDGKSQTKFVDKDNFTIFPPVQPTGDLLRRERDIYWYGEWNPGYTPPS